MGAFFIGDFLLGFVLVDVKFDCGRVVRDLEIFVLFIDTFLSQIVFFIFVDVDFEGEIRADFFFSEVKVGFERQVETIVAFVECDFKFVVVDRLSSRLHHFLVFLQLFLLVM